MPFPLPCLEITEEPPERGATRSPGVRPERVDADLVGLDLARDAEGHIRKSI